MRDNALEAFVERLMVEDIALSLHSPPVSIQTLYRRDPGPIPPPGHRAPTDAPDRDVDQVPMPFRRPGKTVIDPLATT